MNMTKIAAILPLLLTGSAFAQDPFYSITEVTTATAGSSITTSDGTTIIGPWALSISGDGTAISSLAVKSDWYHYFYMSPSGMDLAHRFHYDIPRKFLTGTNTNTYEAYSNWAATWFADLSANTAQTYNVASGSATAETDDAGIITKYGRDETEVTSVGYVSLASHQRKAVATIPNISSTAPNISSTAKDLTKDLTNGTDYAFASAYDIVPTSSGYLVVGTAGAQKATAYSYCYSNSTIATYSAYCPGYQTQAAFWSVASDGTVTAPTLATSYNTSESTNYPYTASGMSIADVDGVYVAVGYSSTVGYSSVPKNLATFWNLGDGSLSAAPTTAAIFASSGDNPGTNDNGNTIDNSWAVGINNNGYIVGNRVYRKRVSLNYPTQMFVAKFSSGTVSSSSLAVSLPSAKIGIPVSTSGVNSEAAALNNHDLVVGWTDERSDVSKPVYGSVPRLQEAFLYNINTGTRYAINDLICSGAATCSQNGKYYYIEYANGITDDGTIVASARRFDNYSDWSTLSNGTSVVVRLNVSSSTAFDSNYNVPFNYVITNQLPVFDYGASSGGGSFGIFGLLAMVGAAAVGQYRRFVKKGS